MEEGRVPLRAITWGASAKREKRRDREKTAMGRRVEEAEEKPISKNRFLSLFSLYLPEGGQREGKWAGLAWRRRIEGKIEKINKKTRN